MGDVAFGAPLLEGLQGQSLVWSARLTEAQTAWVVNLANTSGVHPEEMHAAMSHALGVWAPELPFGPQLRYFQGADPALFQASLAQDGVNRVFFAGAAPDMDPLGDGGVAYAQLWEDEAGTVIEADIVLNDRAYTFVADPAEAGVGSVRPTVHLASVLTHELGHVWGLGHSKVVGGAMVPWSWPGLDQPTCDERATVAAAYRAPFGGQVRGQDAALGGVEVVLWDRLEGQAVGAVAAEDDGGFALEGVPPGTYDLLAYPAVEGPPSACPDGTWQPTPRQLDDQTLWPVQVLGEEVVQIAPWSVSCAPTQGPPGAPSPEGGGALLSLDEAGEGAWWVSPEPGEWAYYTLQGPLPSSLHVLALGHRLGHEVGVRVRLVDPSGRELRPQKTRYPLEQGGWLAYDAESFLAEVGDGPVVVALKTTRLDPSVLPAGEAAEGGAVWLRVRAEAPSPEAGLCEAPDAPILFPLGPSTTCRWVRGATPRGERGCGACGCL